MIPLSTKLDNFLTYSIVFIIPLLLTGPFLADLTITLISILFIFFLIKKKNTQFLKDFFFIFLSTFIIISFFSSLISGNFKSIISSIGYFRFLFFVYLMTYMIKNSKNNLYLLTFYVIFFSFLYLLFEFISQTFLNTTLAGNEVLNPTRYILSSFYHEEIYSSYIVRILPLFIGLFFLNKDKLNSLFKFGFYFLLIFLTIAVIKNGERSSIGLLVLSFIFFLIFLKIGIKNKLIIILISLIGSPILYLNLTDLSLQRKLEGITSLKLTLENLRNKTNEEKIILSEKYDSLYKTSINIYKEYPLIGSGIKNFRNICSEERFSHNDRSCSTHPHNLLLQILAETGTIGLIYYLSIIFILIKLLIKNLNQKLHPIENTNYFTCLICGVFVSLWPFFPSGNFFNNWMSIIMFFPIGFLLKEVYYQKKQQNL